MNYNPLTLARLMVVLLIAFTTLFVGLLVNLGAHYTGEEYIAAFALLVVSLTILERGHEMSHQLHQMNCDRVSWLWFLTDLAEERNARERRQLIFDEKDARW